MAGQGNKDAHRIATPGSHPQDNHGVVNPPVYRASTVLFRSVQAARAPRQLRGITYGRAGTPTTFALAEAFTALEGAPRRVFAASGLAAMPRRCWRCSRPAITC